MKAVIWLASVLCVLTGTVFGANQANTKTCVVPAHSNGEDDSPAIKAAFESCGSNGHIIFAENNTYSIQQVLQLHNLSNVQIDLRGTLLVKVSFFKLGTDLFTFGPSTQQMCAIGFSTDHIIRFRTYQLH